jgi:hypothetical protein
MYRDDPLDDEAELREVIGDAPVDELLEAGGTEAVLAAIDAFRLLQGWVDDDTSASWLRNPQRRLIDRSPLQALADGGVRVGLSRDVSRELGGLIRNGQCITKYLGSDIEAQTSPAEVWKRLQIMEHTFNRAAQSYSGKPDLIVAPARDEE